MRNVTAAFVLLGPPLILLVDLLIWRWCGDGATITGVVRSWAASSSWPEALFVVGVAVLYLHLFRGLL